MLWKLEEQSRKGNICRIFLHFKSWTNIILRKRKYIQAFYMSYYQAMHSLNRCPFLFWRNTTLLPQKVKDMQKRIAEINDFCQLAYLQKAKFRMWHFCTSLSPTFCCAQGRTNRRKHEEIHDTHCLWAAASQASGSWAPARYCSQPCDSGPIY